MQTSGKMKLKLAIIDKFIHKKQKLLGRENKNNACNYPLLPWMRQETVLKVKIN